MKEEHTADDTYYNGMNVFKDCDEHYHEDEDGIVNINSIRQSLDFQRLMTRKQNQLNSPPASALSPRDKYLNKHFYEVKEQKRKMEKMLGQLNDSKLSKAMMKKRDGSYKIDKSLKVAIQTNQSIKK